MTPHIDQSIKNAVNCDRPVYTAFGYKKCPAANRCKRCQNYLTWVWERRAGVEILRSTRTHMLRLSFRYEPDRKTAMSEFKKFMKRVRKNHADTSFRYLCVAEYGSKGGRLHLHTLLHSSTKVPTRSVRRCWKSGQTHGKLADQSSARYVTKYVTKDNQFARIPCSQGYGMLPKGALDHAMVIKTFEHFPNARVRRVTDPVGVIPRKLYRNAADHARNHGLILPNSRRRCEQIVKRFNLVSDQDLAGTISSLRLLDANAGSRGPLSILQEATMTTNDNESEPRSGEAFQLPSLGG